LLGNGVDGTLEYLALSAPLFVAGLPLRPPPFFVERLWPALVDAKRLRFAGPNLATMLADTMVPEALEHARQPAGLATTLGFVVAFGIAQLEPPADRKEGLSEP
jgi:hypothetical protein